MADVAEEVIETVTEAVAKVAENLTNVADGEEITGKRTPSTPEGNVTLCFCEKFLIFCLLT